MNMIFSTVLALFLVVVGVLADDGTFSVSTPSSVVECGSVQVPFSGGKAPFTVAVLDADDACGEPIETFTPTSSQSYTWKSVNVAQGTQIIFSITDADKLEIWTQDVTVGKGNSTDCVATSTSSVIDFPASSTPASSSPTDVSSSGSSGSGGGSVPVNVGPSADISSASSLRVPFAALLVSAVSYVLL